MNLIFFCDGAAANLLQARYELFVQQSLQLREFMRIKIVGNIRDIPDARLGEKFVAYPGLYDVAFARHPRS